MAKVPIFHYNSIMDHVFDKPVTDVPVVVIDTETTGLSPALGHRVVEVAALRLEGWQEVGRLNQLVNPGRPIEPGASRVNGIYDRDVANAPPFAHIARPLLDLIDGALLVAHNAQFDAGFLALEIALLHNSDSDRAALPNPWLCTLQLARRLFYFSRNNLGTVARELGVPTGRAHRAMNDVVTTTEILKRMVRQAGQYRLQTVSDLLHAQGGAVYAPPPPHPSLPPVIAEALARQRPLRISYRSGGRQTDRVIKPLYPTERNGNVYVVAFCQLRRSQRTFRLDRIVSARLLERTGN